jgi:hypothetical protein
VSEHGEGGPVDEGALKQGWREVAEAAFTEVAAWRREHPRATFREIEAAVEQEVARVRARLLQDTALASPARTGADGGRCRSCGEALSDAGQQSRTLVTQHDQPVELRRNYRVCPACGAGVFPPG